MQHETSCFANYGITPCICSIIKLEKQQALSRFWDSFNDLIAEHMRMNQPDENVTD